MLRLILNSLRTAPGRYVLMAIPICLGGMALSVLSAAYLAADVIAGVGASGLSENEIIVSPKLVDIPFLFRKREEKGLSPKEVDEFSRLGGVMTVTPRFLLQSPASISIDVLGQTLESDVPLYGIEPNAIEPEIKGFLSSEESIPVILPRELVLALGSTLADAFGYPRLSEDLLIGRKLTILDGYSTFFPSKGEQAREYPATIVGFSSKIPFLGISIPTDDLRRIADASGNETKIASVLIAMSPNADITSIRNQIEEMGFATDSYGQRLGFLQDRLSVLLSVLVGLGSFLLVFVIVTVVAIISSDVLLSTRQIGIMRSFGATNGRIRSFFIGKVMIVCLLSASTGAVLGTFGSSWTQAIFAAHFPGLGIESWSITRDLGIMIGTVVLLSLVSILASLPPILRANRLSPIRALGEET